MSTLARLEALEKNLRQRFGPKLTLKITDNRHTMISARKEQGVYHLRLHHLFLTAPDEVLDGISAYVRGQRTPEHYAHVDHWIEKQHHLIAKRQAEAKAVQPYGEVHDLTENLSRLNQHYFGGQIVARITWTRAARKQRRRSIVLGTYAAEEQLIRIHPALDQDFVPKYFVDAVVYHEMLHEKHNTPNAAGRRSVHTREFLADEKRFVDYQRARNWEKAQLQRLLKY